MKAASRDALVVSPKGGSTTRVELANVLSASFISSSDAVPDLPMSKGIVMASGSAIACESLLRADADVVRIEMIDGDGRQGEASEARGGGAGKGQAKQIAVKTADVARIVLASLPAELLKRAPRGHSGVLLAGGDFVEGEFRGIDGGKVRISSVLFGLQSFDAASQAVAVILRDAREPTDAPMVGRLADGSVLAAKSAASVSFERGTTAISIDERTFGTTIVAPVKDLIDLRAGGERIVSLAELKPAGQQIGSATEGSATGGTATGGLAGNGSRMDCVIDATTCGAPAVLLGLSPRRAIGQSGGTSISFDLAGGEARGGETRSGGEPGGGGRYVSFIARAGVPLGVAPSGRARFIVLVDGVEKFRSEPRTSIDDPISLAISLRGARSLTLRVEPAVASTAGSTGGSTGGSSGGSSGATLTSDAGSLDAGLSAPGLWADPLLVKSSP